MILFRFQKFLLFELLFLKHVPEGILFLQNNLVVTVGMIIFNPGDWDVAVILVIAILFRNPRGKGKKVKRKETQGGKNSN